jgi:hypothetical protein
MAPLMHYIMYPFEGARRQAECKKAKEKEERKKKEREEQEAERREAELDDISAGQIIPDLPYLTELGPPPCDPATKTVQDDLYWNSCLTKRALPPLRAEEVTTAQYSSTVGEGSAGQSLHDVSRALQHASTALKNASEALLPNAERNRTLLKNIEGNYRELHKYPFYRVERLPEEAEEETPPRWKGKGKGKEKATDPINSISGLGFTESPDTYLPTVSKGERGPHESATKSGQHFGEDSELRLV